MPKSIYSQNRDFISARLIQAREESGLTQLSVAETEIISQSELSKIENGQRRVEFLVLLDFQNFTLSLLIILFHLTSLKIYQRNEHKKLASRLFGILMDFIVNHPNYGEGDFPDKYKKDGTVRSVSTNTSKIGKIQEYYGGNNKRKILQTANKAEVARFNLSKEELGEKRPCQICGRKLNINYVYPNKNT